MDKRFIVQEDKGVVIAIKHEFDSVFDELIDCCSKETALILSSVVLNSCLWNDIKTLELENSCFKGVAKCDEYDSFDVKKGVDIAGLKADMKYHRSMAKKYKLIVNMLDHALDEISALYLKHLTKECDIAESIDRRYCREEE